MTFILRTSRGLERLLARELVSLGCDPGSVAIHSDGQVWLKGGSESEISKSVFTERLSRRVGDAGSLDELAALGRGVCGRVEFFPETPVVWAKREILGALGTGRGPRLIAAGETGNRVRLEVEIFNKIEKAEKLKDDWSLFSTEETGTENPCKIRGPPDSVLAGFLHANQFSEISKNGKLTAFDPFVGDARLFRVLQKKFPVLPQVCIYGAGTSPEADLRDFENPQSQFRFTKNPFEKMLDKIADPFLMTVVPKTFEKKHSKNVHAKLERLGVVCKNRPDFRGLWILSDDNRVKAWSGLQFECMHEYGCWKVFKWLGRKS